MSQTSTHSRVVFCSLVYALLLVLVGCATSSYTPFEGTVSQTISPLVAQYSVRHHQPGFTVWVEFGPDTSYGRQTSVMSDSVTDSGGTVVTVLVAGMRPATTYHMRAHVDSPTASWIDQDRTFTTGPLLGAPGEFSIIIPAVSINLRHATDGGTYAFPRGGIAQHDISSASHGCRSSRQCHLVLSRQCRTREAIAKWPFHHRSWY